MLVRVLGGFSGWGEIVANKQNDFFYLRSHLQRMEGQLKDLEIRVSALERQTNREKQPAKGETVIK